MRVLTVTNLYPTEEKPGVGTFIAAHVEGLRAAGVDTPLLHVNRAEHGRTVYRGLGKNVSKVVTEVRPDVVHVLYGGVLADVVTRAVRNVPVVVSFYGSDLLGADLGGRLHARLSARYGVLASRRAALRAGGVIVQSEKLLDALPAGVPPESVWVVPAGIDLTRFRPLDPSECRGTLGWSRDRRHVLFPARRTRPEKRYALAAAGVELLAESGVPVELHALEGVAHADVPLWLNAADVVLLTSKYEGSPNVVKEALACDVAVVSVDVGDVRELLRGVAGCFVAEPSPESIAEKLGAALRHPGRVASRESVAELGLPRVAERMQAIYALVLDRAGQRQTLR